MTLSKEAQIFADATTLHIDDSDFPQFCGPIILDLMKDGHTDAAIAEAMVDGMGEALKDIDPYPEGMREQMIAGAQNGIIAKFRAGYTLAQSFNAEYEVVAG